MNEIVATVTMFPALNGDCFLVKISDTVILIDGGYINTYGSYIKPALQRLKEEIKALSHVIVTHIDGDHISGINRFLEENISDPIMPVTTIWHNAYRHIQPFAQHGSVLESLAGKPLDSLVVKSYLKEEKKGEEKNISAEQGSTLASLITKSGYQWNNEFNGKAVSTDNLDVIPLNTAVTLKLLSPDNDKLQALYKYWRKELYKLGYSNVSDKEVFFDDAFEFLASQEKQIKIPVDRDIAYKGMNMEQLADEDFTTDTAPVNGSSIAFVLECSGKTFLFLGDAHPDLIVKGLKHHYEESLFPIKFDMIKLAHHGSILNTSTALLELIDSEKYVFSTNGKMFDHPDLATIARIITRKSAFKRELIFNYPVKVTETLNDPVLSKKYNYVLTVNDGAKPVEINF